MVLHTRIIYLFGFPDKSFIPVGHHIQRSWETADWDHSKSYWRLFSCERHDQNYVCDDKLPPIFLKVKLSVVQGIQADGVRSDSLNSLALPLPKMSFSLPTKVNHRPSQTTSRSYVGHVPWARCSQLPTKEEGCLEHSSADFFSTVLVLQEAHPKTALNVDSQLRWQLGGSRLSYLMKTKL